MQWATAIGDVVSDMFIYRHRHWRSRTSRGLLLAEALHALGSHVGRLWVCVREVGGRKVVFVVVVVKLACAAIEIQWGAQTTG